MTKTAEQITNLIKLKELWELTPPEAVIEDLNWWNREGNGYPCGAVACIGGWVAASGWFPEVTTGNMYDPIFRASRWKDVSTTVFGERSLFLPRGFNYGESYDKKRSDWQVAYDRILRALGYI
jgi:hypothetical protein